MTEKSAGMPEGIRTAMSWALGVGIIALVLLILVILFGNLQGNVGFGTTPTTFTNETIILNDSATPSTAQGRVNGILSNVVITNATDGVILSSGNYTVSGVIITNTTGVYIGQNVNVSATVTYDTQGKIDSDNIILNYTASAVNVSKQFPTVGTIIGVALLLVILIGVLVFAIRKMLGVASATGTGGSSESSFERGGFG